MRKRKSIFFIFISAVIITVYGGCKQSEITREEIARNDFPLAVIDSTYRVMASDLYLHLAKSSLIDKGGILDSTIYFDTLQAIVIDSLISMEADTINLRGNLSLYRTYRSRFQDAYLTYIYRKLILDSIKVDSVKIDSFYRAHPEKYSLKEQVHARQLVVSDKGLRYGKDSSLYKNYSMEQLDSIAKVLIYDYRRRIDSGENLGALAFQFSVNRESGDHYGDLQYFIRGTYNEEFEKMAFSLPKGEISQPFQTPDGWHIVQVIDHIDAGLMKPTPEIFMDASRQYKTERATVRARAFIDSVTAASQIIFNDSALVRPARQVPDTIWAAVVNNMDTVTFYRLGDVFDIASAQMGADSLTLTDKHRVLLREAQKYMIMEVGDKLGLGNDSAMAADRQNLYHKYARNAVTARAEDPDYLAPENEIADYYAKNIDKYTYKKPLYVQHIIVDDSVFGEYLRDQALSGVDFLSLAKQYYPGAEEIRVAAADLGYIGPGEMPESFYRAALGTAKNDVSHPVKTEWGYHIIKVVDRKADRPLQEVSADIATILKKEYNKRLAAEWQKDLLDRHRVIYTLDRVKRIKLPPKERR